MVKAIEVRGLSKDFPVSIKGASLRAVDHLDLNIEQGVVFGLLGPNGSGKSTTIKAILGLLEPTAGETRILGVSSKNPAARLEVGYLPEAPYFQGFLTGRELLSFFGKLSGLRGSEIGDRADFLLERVGLSDAADRRLAGYSKGMLQRIGLAQAMMGDPKILILDEPTAGVDPVGSSEIGALIRELRKEGKTILLCSHLLSQVENVCDRVAVMNRGRLLKEGSLDELIAKRSGDSFRVDGLGAADRERVFDLVKRAGGRVEASNSSLQDLFLQLSKSSEKDAPKGDD